MFVANAITVWVEALKALFDSDYPDPHLRNVKVGTDYPESEIEYPNIWVNFVSNGEVSNAGIGHYELVDNPNGTSKAYLRWTFAGHAEFVIGAMGNLERALMIDEISKAIAISGVKDSPNAVLRSHVQQSDIIGMIASWEAFTVGGFGETVGTPWGTDDVIYEASISLPVEGEVLFDPTTGDLIDLTSIKTTPLGPGEGDPPVVTGGTAIGDWV